MNKIEEEKKKIIIPNDVELFPSKPSVLEPLLEFNDTKTWVYLDKNKFRKYQFEMT